MVLPAGVFTTIFEFVINLINFEIAFTAFKKKPHCPIDKDFCYFCFLLVASLASCHLFVNHGNTVSLQVVSDGGNGFVLY